MLHYVILVDYQENDPSLPMAYLDMLIYIIIKTLNILDGPLGVYKFKVYLPKTSSCVLTRPAL